MPAGSYDIYLRNFSFANPGSGSNVGAPSAGSGPTLLSSVVVAAGQTTNVGTIGGSANCCGNWALDPGEVCDAPELNGATCESEGRPGGTLRCQDGCLAYNLDWCDEEEVCGDGILNGAEDCDGDDLNGASCENYAYSGGTLACDGSCLYDFSGCFAYE